MPYPYTARPQTQQTKDCALLPSEDGVKRKKVTWRSGQLRAGNMMKERGSIRS